ncbi:MAG: hypothetical protein ABI823_22040 [Bryobacteraceae bacterium]
MALSPDTVRPGLFGKLATLPVAGCVLAQPLLASKIVMPDGSVRNVVYLATTANRVYGFDANEYTPLWQKSFGTAPLSTDFVPGGDYHDFPDCDAGFGDGPIGIVGTPVIDLESASLFFVANTEDGPDGARRYHFFLHRISMATGDDLVPPVEIQGTDAGVAFEPFYQLQRTALLLLNGRIYVAFASHQDSSPYYGWLFAYDTNLKRVRVKNYSPKKSGAGIWQSGGGPASDGTSIYFTTGNLAEDVATAADNSDSILKVDPETLEVQAKASFPKESTKWDQNFDLDLGSSRAIVVPETGNVIAGSKYGDGFVMRPDQMKVATRFQMASRHSDGFDWTGIYNGFAYWNGTIYTWPGGGGFIWGEDPESPFPTDTLKAFNFDFSARTMRLIANGQSDGLAAGYQGANLAISANGNQADSGIVWALVPESNTKSLQPGSLHAYRAGGFAGGTFEELWNSYDENDADARFYFAKFNQPMIADGKVFLPTFSGKVIVYGALPDGVQQSLSKRPSPPYRVPAPQNKRGVRSIIAK